ncbi:MAG: DUF4290 domain-containing protein [Bacteroidales bacterium]|nr:DUF4290 domain-containing protein [Bacteroidales bacterium]
MEYNTTRNKLSIPEYGRNVQKLINYAKAIEDRSERTQFANMIIRIMGAKQTDHQAGDYRQKLWDHLHYIANFELDVDSPYEKPDPEEIFKKPEPLTYKSGEIKYKHYGKNLARMFDRACEMEEGEDKDLLIRILANHMKKSYLTWNRDSVNDQLIYQHLSILTNGQYNVGEEELRLHHTNEILARTRKRRTTTTDSRSSDSRGSYRSDSRSSDSRSSYRSDSRSSDSRGSRGSDSRPGRSDSRGTDSRGGYRQPRPGSSRD